MGRTYRPRHLLELTVTREDGTTIVLPIRVQSAKWHKNEHTKADELHTVLNWQDAGVDPRILDNGIGVYYLGNADDEGNWDPGSDDVRFVGRVTRVQRHGGDEAPLTVEIGFVDYTSFFILAKPVATRTIPKLEHTLAEAWRCIVEGLGDEKTGESQVADLADAIEFRGLEAPGPVIGTAQAKRFRQIGGKLSVDPKKDAWAIWQDIVGSLGLISFFELDRLVVTTALDLYTARNTPIFINGLNIQTFNEERNNDFDRKGVGISSFDPLTGTTLEAVWPPPGDARLVRKVPKAHKPTKASHSGHAAKAKKAAAPEHRDYFLFPGITDPDKLLELAKTVYEQRSRQEFTGSITTGEMSVEGAEAQEIDLLALRSGDTCKIEIDETDWAGEQIIDSLPTLDARAEYLEGKGYSPSIARLLAENLDDLTNIRREFYVKGVQVSLSLTPEGGTFAVELTYCNKIQKGGETWTSDSGKGSQPQKVDQEYDPDAPVDQEYDPDAPNANAPPPDLPPFQ